MSGTLNLAEKGVMPEYDLYTRRSIRLQQLGGCYQQSSIPAEHLQLLHLERSSPETHLIIMYAQKFTFGTYKNKQHSRALDKQPGML